MAAPSTRAKTLTKRELIERLSRKTVSSKKEIERVLSLFLRAILNALKEGGTVQLIPFGTFSTRVRQARRVRNPRTGQMMTCCAIRVPIFRPGRLLRQALK